MNVKYYRNNDFVENVWPANLALFIYVSTHCVETGKWLDYNRYSQLTPWCSGNASALGARGPGFNPRLRQGFLCLIFFVLLLLCFYFFVQNTVFIAKHCNSFCNVNLFSILNVLQYLWPIIRVKRYRPSIFKLTRWLINIYFSYTETPLDYKAFVIVLDIQQLSTPNDMLQLTIHVRCHRVNQIKNSKCGWKCKNKMCTSKKRTLCNIHLVWERTKLYESIVCIEILAPHWV